MQVAAQQGADLCRRPKLCRSRSRSGGVRSELPPAAADCSKSAALPKSLPAARLPPARQCYRKSEDALCCTSSCTGLQPALNWGISSISPVTLI